MDNKNYKYSIHINQFACIENGLDLDIIDLAIFDYIKDFYCSNKCVKIQTEEGLYFWVSHSKIITDMPLLRIKTKQGLINRINNLIKANVLEKHPNCDVHAKTLYKFGSNYDLLIFNQNSNIDKCQNNFTPLNENLGYPSTKVYPPLNETLGNNSIINNKELINNNINNNPEIENFGFEQELFEKIEIEQLPLEAKKQKPKEKSCVKKEKVQTIEDLAFPLINDFWLKEFKVGYQYTAKDGLKAKSIIKKLKASILLANDFCDEITILNAFKAICSNLNNLGDFYATADLSLIDSKYNTIIEQIKTMKHGKQQTNNRQATATSAVEYARQKYGF